MMDVVGNKYDVARKKIEKKFKYKNLLNTNIEYPENRFVIYTRGRTGSSLLSDLLNCHNDVFCDVEIFNFIYSNSRVKYPLLYINNCSKRASINNRAVYGFKVKISQLRFEHGYKHYDKILLKLHARGWKFIYLKRLNYLRHKISNFLTTRSNIFHVKNGDDYVPNKIKIDCKELMRGIVYSEEVEKTEIENLKNIPHLKLIYEKDILNANHQNTADKVFSFLGLSSNPVKTEFKRITMDNLAEIILNYDEVYNYFKDSKYSEYLK